MSEVAFGLNKPAVDDIMNRGAWSDEARKVMINFLESYKTAYALKRLDYISSIFSNDASSSDGLGGITPDVRRAKFPLLFS